MPSLKEFRSRIASVKSTQKITKAMQMVAAAKLKRGQNAAEAARPYALAMARVVANLAAAVKGDGAPRLLQGAGKDKDDVHLLVVITSERGLCGGFNTQIVRAAREKITELQRAGKTVKLLCVGKKGRDQLRRLYAAQIVDYVDLSAYRVIEPAAARIVGDRVRTLFEEGAFDVATMFFSRFQSVISQTPTGRQLIPAVAPEGVSPPDLKGAVYEYEPGEEEILEALLPRYLDGQILQALLENQAGFAGAQMTAMDNATRNAGDMIKKLTLRYNRQRQANITKELIEIISGAEAL
jgi:F-type H+-transporting ATPase subunit gamma